VLQDDLLAILEDGTKVVVVDVAFTAVIITSCIQHAYHHHEHVHEQQQMEGRRRSNRRRDVIMIAACV
jgi:hypothetical protein